MDKLRPYLKAAGAAVLAGLGVALAATADDRVSAQEWIGIAIAVVGTPLGVYRLPYQSSRPPDVD